MCRSSRSRQIIYNHLILSFLKFINQIALLKSDRYIEIRFRILKFYAKKAIKKNKEPRMKVTFEQLKAAFNRVLIYAALTAKRLMPVPRCSPAPPIRRLFSRRQPFPSFHSTTGNGDIIPNAQPKRITSLGAIERGTPSVRSVT